MVFVHYVRLQKFYYKTIKTIVGRVMLLDSWAKKENVKGKKRTFKNSPFFLFKAQLSLDTERNTLAIKDKNQQSIETQFINSLRYF